MSERGKVLLQKLRSFFHYVKNSGTNNKFKPVYKLYEILEKDEEYEAVIQLVGKNVVFHAKPEDILSDDALVDRFSPRDIRTLTYLGYLDINGPKYKILAKKLSQHDKATFLIKKKGVKTAFSKTVDQMIYDADIIQHLHPNDAHAVGYTAASESILSEKKEKEALKNDLR